MSIQGRVIEVTPAGDLISDIAADQLANVPRGDQVRVVVDQVHETFGIFGGEHGQPAMTLIALLPEPPAVGPLVLSLVGDSAADMLGVGIGAPVEVCWS
jgi:hypothetical protein